MMRSRHERDRGEASTQVILVVPVIVLVLTLAIQAALVFHARAVAGAAAARGASVAAGAEYAGMAAAVLGVHAASDMVRRLGAEEERSPEVSMVDGEVAMSVAVRVPRVAPFFPDVVTRVVIEPLERTTTEAER